MLFGDPQRFAVEARVIVPAEHTGPEHLAEHDRFVYGHCCFWVGGTQVGRLAEIESLRVMQGACDSLLRHRDDREARELASCEPAELVAFLDEKLYGGLERSRSEIRRDTRIYWRHNLHPQGVESFDRIGRLFLVENDADARLVYCGIDAQPLEVELETGFVDDVLAQFVRWFDEQHPQSR